MKLQSTLVITRWRALIVAFALLFVLVSSSAVQADSANPGVLPPNSNPFGMNYIEWQMEWWAWAYSMPLPPPPEVEHPMFNADTEDDLLRQPLAWIGDYDAARGQSGHVWFLAGTHMPGWDVVREATIPSGTALFLPVKHFSFYGVWPEIESIVRAALKQMLDSGTIFCEIDGVPVKDLYLYRHSTPMFDLDPPYVGIVNEGYYLMVAPLSVGEHTIHTQMTMIALLPPPPGTPVPCEEDVTFNITVTPGNSGK